MRWHNKKKKKTDEDAISLIKPCCKRNREIRLFIPLILCLIWLIERQMNPSDKGDKEKTTHIHIQSRIGEGGKSAQRYRIKGIHKRHQIGRSGKSASQVRIPSLILPANN